MTWRRINPRAYLIARAHTAVGEALYEELEWYADPGEPPRLLGLVLRDRVDNDYWVVMARGANLQYPAVDRELRPHPRCSRQRPACGPGSLDGGAR
jgi:hypothetical protein